MKQFNPKKVAPAPQPAKTVTRQEIDTCVKHIVQVLDKDPKKAAKIFESWLDTPAKSLPRKKAA